MRTYNYNGCTVRIQSEFNLHLYTFKRYTDDNKKEFFAQSLSEAEDLAGPGYVLLMIHA